MVSLNVEIHLFKLIISTIELGHFSVILSLVLSICQLVLFLIGNWKGWINWLLTATIITPIVFFLIFIGFISLLLAFIRSDFSVLLVAEHSHSLKPLLYKVTGIWGNHEGSMMLWILCISLFSFLIFIFRAQYPIRFLSYLLSSQAMILSSFLYFLLFASNPFLRLLDPPYEGMGLNPVLQDPALAFHPPLLYLGYVGLCVSYSFAIAGLVDGRINSRWASWLRSWTLFSWVFLTIGITLGSWWAYYELGWGGFWFWDPVENSSLMPWLAATALLHSNNVLLKRNIFQGWTVLLALFAFLFSLIGTFIVRSGIIASVHAFAVDPERGVYLLMIIMLIFLVALILYIYRAGSFSGNAAFIFFSRESALIFNNLILCVSAIIIFLGTIWPFLIEFLLEEQISVGPPFFNLSLAPFALMLGLFLPIGANISWRKDTPKASVRTLQFSFYISILLCMLPAIVYSNFELLLLVGVALGFWVIAGALTDLIVRAYFQNLLNWISITKIELGKNISHMGVGFLILGVSAISTLEKELIKEVKIGETFSLDQYDITFQGVERKNSRNYISDVALLSIKSRAGEFILRPEKRFYTVQETVTSEVAIKKYATSDLYAVLGDFRQSSSSNEKSWIIRIYVKPFISLVWLGSFLIAAGGVVSLLSRRRLF